MTDAATAASAGPLPADRRAAVVRQSIGVGLATGAYGISLGALGVAAGLSVWQTQVTSLLLFSGGSQFALIGILAGGGSGVSAVATSTLLGVRNGLYGLQVGRLLDVHGWRRLLAAHLTIDESTAVGLAQPEPRGTRLGFWVTGLAVFVFWNLSTLLGALLGSSLGDPRQYGLDAAAAAAFVGLLWPRLRGRDPLVCAAAAMVVTVLLVPVLPTGVPVLVAGLVAVVVGLIPRRRAAGPADPTDVAADADAATRETP